MDTIRELSEVGTTSANAESPFVIARRNRPALERRAREMRDEEIARHLRALARGVANAMRAVAQHIHDVRRTYRGRPIW
jgi:hypothetical protein